MVGFLDGGGDWSAVHCCGGGHGENATFAGKRIMSCIRIAASDIRRA